MAGAGEGGSRGLDASPEPTEPARAEDAATQALPTVRRTTFQARKPTVIRAVARRAAAALPALGREGGAQPIPRSARATVDRRRRAAAREAAAAHGDEEGPSTSGTESPAQEAAPASAQDPVEPAAARDPEDAPTGQEPVGGDPAADDQAAHAPVADDPAADELAGEESASSTGVGRAEETPAREESSGVQPVPDSPPEDGPTGHGAAGEPPADTAVPSEGTATGVVPVPRPTVARHRRDDDAPEPSRTPAPAGAVPVGITVARTDEWTAISQETVALPAIDDAGASAGREGLRVGGPSVLEADSWDADIETGSRSDSYHGRRRARSRFPKVWLLVAVVVAVLVGVVTVPYLFGGTTSNVVPPPTSPQPIAIAPSPPTELAATSSPPASPTPSPTPPTTKAAPPPPPPPTSTTAAPTTSAPPAFAPVTVEGEAVAFGGARPVPVAGASGGQVADFLGEWPGPDGELRFDVTVPTAGAYTMTVTYVFVELAGDSSRRMRVRVNGNPLPGEVVFGRVTSCCGTRSITLTLQAGVNSIRLYHNDRRMPAVDKVVITQA